jgi:hypothetical protein
LAEQLSGDIDNGNEAVIYFLRERHVDAHTIIGLKKELAPRI